MKNSIRVGFIALMMFVLPAAVYAENCGHWYDEAKTQAMKREHATWYQVCTRFSADYNKGASAITADCVAHTKSPAEAQQCEAGWTFFFGAGACPSHGFPCTKPGLS